MALSYVAGVITIAGSFMLASCIPGTSLSQKTTNMSRVEKTNIIFNENANRNNVPESSNVTDVDDSCLFPEENELPLDEIMRDNLKYLLTDDRAELNNEFQNRNGNDNNFFNKRFNTNDQNYFYEYNNYEIHLPSTITTLKRNHSMCNIDVDCLFQQKIPNQHNFFHFLVNKFL